MVKWLVVLACLSGCFDDRYKCTSDAQCNLGEGGRCEVDGFCTKFDDTCATHRRYQHAGEHGDECFDDRVVPVNACAGGQPPAREEGCFAGVCTRVPACCTIAWTDACVQLAQELCTSLACDTRIAITATRGTITELWDLRWNGAWQILKRGEFAQPLQWVAPAPGETQPRLAGTSGVNELVVGEQRFAIEAGRIYSSITSIDFDRDRRDTLVVGHSAAGGGDQRLDIIKPHDGSLRSTPVQAASGLTWGDLDRDTFPDAVTRTAAQYHYVPSFDGANHVRDVETRTILNPQGGQTPPAPIMRTTDWIDLNGDKRLDLVAFGASVQIHTDDMVLRENPEYRIDCDPPSAANPLPCNNATPEPNFEAMSFAGAARPSKDGNELVISTFPGRKLVRASFAGSTLELTNVRFPGDTCACTESCSPECPGAGCVCTYDCSPCLPIIAVVVRDLDGDHALDIVAIDAKLNVYHAFAATGFTQWVGPTVIPTSLTNPQGFLAITTSVSGATL